MLRRMTYTNELNYGYFNVLPAVELRLDRGRILMIGFSWLWFALRWDLNS
jgi:hypothetical protein